MNFTFPTVLYFFSAMLFCLGAGGSAQTPALQTGTASYFFDADIPTQSFPAGKTLIVPVAATDANGNALRYLVASSNPHIMVRAKTGNPNLLLNVNYAGDPNSTSAGAEAFSGALMFQLFQDMTPKTVAIIAGLVQGKFYDFLTFHRIASLDGSGKVQSIIVQGGDPNGDGSGGPGFAFDNELNAALIFTGRGQLAMANSGFNPDTFGGSNGSQFFITEGPQRHLDFVHTIFGQLLRGFDVLDKLANVPVSGSNNLPTVKPEIQSAQIVPNNHDAVLYLSADTVGSAKITVKIWDGKTFAPHTGAPLFVTKTFTATATDDSVNDPPFIVPVNDTVTPASKAVSIQFRGVDLESDPLNFTPLALTDSIAKPLLDIADLVQSGSSLQLFRDQLVTQTGTTQGPVSQILWDRFSAGAKAILTNTHSSVALTGTTIMNELNAIISGSSIYDAAAFQNIALSAATRNLLAENPTLTGSTTHLARLNRLLLDDTYPEFIHPAADSVSVSGFNPITITPKANSGFTGGVEVGVLVSDIVGRSNPPPADRTSVNIGIGDKRISVKPVTITTAPNVPLLQQVVANFSDLDTHGSAADFSATINWGDGAPPISGSTVTITSGSLQKTVPPTVAYQVKSTHTYAHEGNYPLTVVVSDTNGATQTAIGSVLVTNNPLVARGRSLKTSGTLRATIASFSEIGGSSHPADFSATVDWGDGQKGEGTIVADKNGGFNVVGAHVYADAEPFTICTTIRDKNGNVANGWSEVRVSGSNTHLPPFPLAQIVATGSMSLVPISTGSSLTITNVSSATHSGTTSAIITTATPVPIISLTDFIQVGDTVDILVSAKGINAPKINGLQQATVSGTYELTVPLSQGVDPILNGISGHVAIVTQEYLAGEIFVENLGARASSAVSLEFSFPDQFGFDIPIQVAPNSRQTLLPLLASANNTYGFPPRTFLKRHFQLFGGVDTRLPLPHGTQGIGKQLQVTLHYSDPLTDHLPVVRTYPVNVFK